MKKTNIGGQALIEGLLMIGPKSAATAVRKADGEIVIEKKELPPKGIFSKIPVIRGITGFVRQMIFGMKALMYSAELVEIEEEIEEPSKFDKFIERVLGNKLKDAAIYFSVFVAIILGVSLFILLPNFLADFITVTIDKTTRGGVITRNLIEGVIRLIIFLSYLALVSKMKDIKRIWQYHGAEHKTIHCYEHGEELTVENVKKYSTKHPRCGTSFLFIVMIVSIIVFSLVGWHGRLLNILLRILLIPIVAGISYELLKIGGRSERKIMKIINAPGLGLQILTTKEPDEKQIEVAIEALKNVLVEDKDADNW
jgi:uncharacterized protein YqhQ